MTRDLTLENFFGSTHGVFGSDGEKYGQLLAPCVHLQYFHGAAPRAHQLDSRGRPRRRRCKTSQKSAL